MEKIEIKTDATLGEVYHSGISSAIAPRKGFSNHQIRHEQVLGPTAKNIVFNPEMADQLFEHFSKVAFIKIFKFILIFIEISILSAV